MMQMQKLVSASCFYFILVLFSCNNAISQLHEECPTYCVLKGDSNLNDYYLSMVNGSRILSLNELKKPLMSLDKIIISDLLSKESELMEKGIDKYLRQYILFSDTLNNQIAYIQYSNIPCAERTPSQLNSLITVKGGGYNYFNVFYNITTKRVLKITINDII
jgi:hypothetical protein